MTRLPTRTVALVASAIVATSAQAQRAAATPRDPALRAEMLRRAADGQRVRDEMNDVLARGGQGFDTTIFTRQRTADSVNTEWFAEVVAARGWPGRSLVGNDGADAAARLVRYAERYTSLQARVLPLLERAYRAGEATGQQVALLTDQLATARRQPQVYGTQARLERGLRVVYLPIADSANVDARRAALGLPPLAAYWERVVDSLRTAWAQPAPPRR
jgi:hypothetical protein